MPCVLLHWFAEMFDDAVLQNYGRYSVSNTVEIILICCLRFSQIHHKYFTNSIFLSPLGRSQWYLTSSVWPNVAAKSVMSIHNIFFFFFFFFFFFEHNYPFITKYPTLTSPLFWPFYCLFFFVFFFFFFFFLLHFGSVPLQYPVVVFSSFSVSLDFFYCQQLEVTAWLWHGNRKGRNLLECVMTHYFLALQTNLTMNRPWRAFKHTSDICLSLATVFTLQNKHARRCFCAVVQYIGNCSQLIIGIKYGVKTKPRFSATC